LSTLVDDNDWTQASASAMESQFCLRHRTFGSIHQQDQPTIDECVRFAAKSAWPECRRY
jgi:hypothetical protein